MKAVTARACIIRTNRDNFIASPPRPIEMWCKKCGKELPMLTPEAAAALAGVSPRAIYRCVERGELHFIDTGGEALLICSGSFLR